MNPREGRNPYVVSLSKPSRVDVRRSPHLPTKCIEAMIASNKTKLIFTLVTVVAFNLGRLLAPLLVLGGKIDAIFATMAFMHHPGGAFMDAARKGRSRLCCECVSQMPIWTHFLCDCSNYV